MTPLIRPPLPHEAEAIARLWHQSWRDAHLAIVPPELTALRTLDSFRVRTHQSLHRMRVVGRGGSILGMTLLLRDEIEQFYVAPEAHGTGLAAALMDDAECQIASRGRSRAWLACAKDNLRARRFYEKQGWIVIDTRPMVFDTVGGPIPITTWRMEKPLTGVCQAPLERYQHP